MVYDADIVWGCAVAVDRINEGYIKEDVYSSWKADEDGNHTTPEIMKIANKKIVKEWLAHQSYDNITEADIAEGKRLREHFKGLLLKEIAGTITDFESNVLLIAQQDTFTSRNIYEFSIISCLPQSVRNEQLFKEERKRIAESTPLEADPGDTIVGELIITKSKFNTNYNKHNITGRFGESFVSFWFKEGCEIGSTVNIKARVKRMWPDGTTQLHYVKKLKIK